MHKVKYAIKHHWTHYLGLASSGLCLIHCIAMPIVIPLLPALSVVGDKHWIIEVIFMILIALTTITIVNGYRLHKAPQSLILAGAGFIFLMASLMLHTFIAEVIASSIGSVFMLSAQYTNYKLCRQQTCCPNPHH